MDSVQLESRRQLRCAASENCLWEKIECIRDVLAPDEKSKSLIIDQETKHSVQLVSYHLARRASSSLRQSLHTEFLSYLLPAKQTLFTTRLNPMSFLQHSRFIVVFSHPFLCNVHFLLKEHNASEERLTALSSLCRLVTKFSRVWHQLELDLSSLCCWEQTRLVTACWGEGDKFLQR